MPLYQFACADCEKEFEALIVRATSNPVAECPSCGSARTLRSFGLPAAPPTLPTGSATNCQGNGPPCGASWCGRRTV